MTLHTITHFLAIANGNGKGFFERHPIASTAVVVIVIGAVISGLLLLRNRKR